MSLGPRSLWNCALHAHSVWDGSPELWVLEELPVRPGPLAGILMLTLVKEGGCVPGLREAHVALSRALDGAGPEVSYMCPGECREENPPSTAQPGCSARLVAQGQDI